MWAGTPRQVAWAEPSEERSARRSRSRGIQSTRQRRNRNTWSRAIRRAISPCTRGLHSARSTARQSPGRRREGVGKRSKGFWHVDATAGQDLRATQSKVSASTITPYGSRGDGLAWTALRSSLGGPDSKPSRLFAREPCNREGSRCALDELSRFILRNPNASLFSIWAINCVILVDRPHQRSDVAGTWYGQIGDFLSKAWARRLVWRDRCALYNDARRRECYQSSPRTQQYGE